MFFASAIAVATAAGVGVAGGDEVKRNAPTSKNIATVEEDAAGCTLWLSSSAGDALRRDLCRGGGFATRIRLRSSSAREVVHGG